MADENRLTFVKSEVSMMEFARHRARELSTLTRIVEKSEGETAVGGGGKRVFQQLPRHMRRRAMSHNSKRVPRRLLELHKRELEKCPKKTCKRPSRKFRRRPKNLLDEYNRRQRRYIWLETHIWHAKRFKMIQRWNYKIPLYPADKSWRACYHASQRAALLQDLSYMCCIQLEGTRSVLEEKLKEVTSADCGLTFACVMADRRESCCVLYKRNSYPYKAICPVRFFWRSSGADSSCLWLWAHPAAFQELLTELTQLFDLIPEQKNEKQERESEKFAESENKEVGKLRAKLYERMPVLRNETVRLTVLKDCLVRLRLLGRWATAILTRTLKAAHVEPLAASQSSSEEKKWWKKMSEEEIETHEKQKEIWENLERKPFSSRMPPYSILGLTVRDPREGLPIQRNKIPPQIPENVGSIETIEVVDARCSSSFIWEEKVRDETTFTKMTDHDMNKIRGQNLIPGTPIDLGSESSRVPILLIQQPGSSSEVDAGWDLIVPAGWAMSFWIPLVYAGARVGGYRERRSLAREFQQPHFPDDFPDTSAGKELEEREKKELLEKYLKYPPNKRRNYVKLGISSPFSFPWQRLLNHWNHEVQEMEPAQDFFVLRNRWVLRSLQRLLFPPSTKKKSEERVSAEMKREIERRLGGSSNYYRALVTCNVRVSSRGALTAFALICKAKNGTAEGVSRTEAMVEPHHKDTRKRERKALSKIKKLKKSSESSPMEVELSEKLKEKENELLFFDPERVVSSSGELGSKAEVLGFVKDGHFSFSTGKFIGTGFVSLAALVELLVEGEEQEGSRSEVLVRSTHSFQYRPAEIGINV